MIDPKLIQAILRQYRLSPQGIHGPIHWGRVMENGIKLAAKTGANIEIVELFAVFHDACRLTEDFDPQHGSRGGDLATRLRGVLFELDDCDFHKLRVACRLHTEGQIEADLTVQTCWDADRLDLGRVGIKPQARYLCTETAKLPEMIAWADDRAAGGFIPAFVERDWLTTRPL